MRYRVPVRRCYFALVLATACAPAPTAATTTPLAHEPAAPSERPAPPRPRERVVTDEHTIGLPQSETEPAASTVSVIRGRVTDSRGVPLEGVTVVATSPALQGTQSAITTSRGDFVLTNLPFGTYVVTFYYADVTLKKPEVRLAAGRPVFLLARLDDSPAAQRERDVVPPPSHVVPSPAPCSDMTSKMADC